MFIILSLILFFMTVINLYANWILFKSFRHTVRFIYLSNVRLIMTNFCIANAVCSFCFLLRSCYHGVLIMYDFHAFEMTRVSCLIFDTPYMVSMSCLSISLIALGVERSLVTVFNYTTSTGFSRNFSKVFVNISWVMGVMNVGMVFSSFKTMSGQHVCYCNAVLAVTEMDLRKSLICYGVLQISGGFCCVYVYTSCKNRLQSTINISRFNNLKERHVRFLNITSSKSLLPNIGSGVALFSLVCCGDFLNHQFYWTNPRDIVSVNYVLASMIFLVSGCFLQVVLFLKNEDNVQKMTNDRFKILSSLIQNFDSSNDLGGCRVGPLVEIETSTDIVENITISNEITQETWNDIWERATLKLY